ncbi:ABC transporter ATP-binding protein [Neorhizobium sp. NCHU2750]|uniref:ABC transporter ATP-binding protein n=1 Tax=Neorhizobium sp. NCHU2750 TaxID=1825976 RepID=UPI000E7132DD
MTDLFIDAVAHTSPPRSDLGSLRRVWALSRSHRPAVIRGLVLRLAQSAFLGLSYATAVHVIIALADGGMPATDWIAKIMLVLALSLVGQLVCGYWAMRYAWLASFKIGRDLRRTLLDHLHRLPLGFHVRRGAGDILSVLTSDTQFVEGFFSDGLPRIAQAIGLPLVMLAFFAVRQPAVAAVACVSILAGLPILIWSSRALSRQAILRQDRQAEATERMIEYVRGMPVIKSFNRIANSQNQFDGALQQFRDISIRMVRQLAVPIVAFGAIILLGVPLLMGSSGAGWQVGMLDRATLLSVLILAFSFYAPLLGLVAVMEHVRMADAALARADHILSQQPSAVALPLQRPEGSAISFSGVGFKHDGREGCLEGLTFEIPERGMTAIVGHSGSGKSTLLNLIAGIFDATDGTVCIGGADVRHLSEGDLSNLVTIVFQDVYLFSGTIADNIAFAKPDASLMEIEDAARLAQAHAFISALPDGYDTQVGEAGSALSGGERQRISIARALLKDTPILLFDEATSAIDPVTEQALQESLVCIAAAKTLIVVAHKLSTISKANQIIVLEHGRIAQRGHHEDLAATIGPYQRLLTSRRKAERWKL